MTENIIKNYKNFIFKLLKEKSISLTIYDGWKRNKTLNPDQINNIFENIFTVQKIPHIDNEEKNIFYLISK